MELWLRANVSLKESRMLFVGQARASATRLAADYFSWVGPASDWSRLGAGSVFRLCCSGSNTVEGLDV
jgi:hypothetical protein